MSGVSNSTALFVWDKNILKVKEQYMAHEDIISAPIHVPETSVYCRNHCHASNTQTGIRTLLQPAEIYYTKQVIFNFWSRTRQITGVKPGKTTENNVCIFIIQIPQSLQQNGNKIQHPFWYEGNGKAIPERPAQAIRFPGGLRPTESLNNPHMNVVRSALLTCRLYPPGNIPGTHLC